MTRPRVASPDELRARPWLSGLAFPEGLRWHAGRLWFSDMLGGAVRSAAPTDASSTVVAEVRGRPSGLGFTADGAMLVASMRGRRVLRYTGSGPAEVADLRPGGWRALNDMIVDPVTDNAYVNAYRHDDGTDSALLLVTPEGRTAIAARLPYPNGLVLLPGTRELVVAGTTTGTLRSYEVVPSGELVPAGVFAELPGRAPDGLAVDAEGGVWTSCYSSGEYLRVERGGRITHRVATPGFWTVACALGGEEGTTLFLARVRTSDEDFRAGRAEGWIDVAEAPIPAAGS